MRQLSMFERDEVGFTRVSVCPDGRGHFIATIAGGWWMAYGDTMQKAVKAVIERYEGDL